MCSIFMKTSPSRAAQKCNEDYQHHCKKNHVEPIGNVKVIRYKQLLDYATNKLGKSLIEEIMADIDYQEGRDDREKSLRIADKLMIYCQELAPAIIILFAPPYYPAVSSTGNALVEACTDFVRQRALEEFNLSIDRIHYFNGLCDLSYVNYQGTNAGWITYEENTPVWGDSYSIPFAEMQQLGAPVLNIGPFGKDAHKRTERLHIRNAFEIIPSILDEMVQMIWQQQM